MLPIFIDGTSVESFKMLAKQSNKGRKNYLPSYFSICHLILADPLTLLLKGTPNAKAYAKHVLAMSIKDQDDFSQLSSY